MGAEILRTILVYGVTGLAFCEALLFLVNFSLLLTKRIRIPVCRKDYPAISKVFNDLADS